MDDRLRSNAFFAAIKNLKSSQKIVDQFAGHQPVQGGYIVRLQQHDSKCHPLASNGSSWVEVLNAYH
jgi:hypothetical protein